MRPLYTFLLSLFFLVGFVGHVYGQDCPTDFTVKATSTPSTCQANGTVTVTLEGEISNLYNIEYSLTSAGGFTLPPEANPVLANIPSGTYTVSVRAFCKNDASYNVVKTAANVVVGGTYKVPEVSFNATASRKSYEGCNTGIIALNVSEGSGTYTFTIVSAPAGVTTGAVSSTQNGTLYTLAGENYPAGDYRVSVNDGCDTSMCQFTLEKASGFPAFFNASYMAFYPVLTANNNCNSLYIYASEISKNNPDFYRYYQDGMYEVGVAPAGSMPTEWVAWTKANLTPKGLLLMNLSPKTYADFYAPNSISVYTRIKGCSGVYTSFTTNIKTPEYMDGGIRQSGCDNFTYNIKPYDDYDGMFCYPLSIVVTKRVNGQEVYKNENWFYDSSGITLTLDYNTNYKITMKGAGTNGPEIASYYKANRDLLFYETIKGCDSYKLDYAVTGYGNTCWPVHVTIKDSSGHIVYTEEVTDESDKVTTPLQYNENYTVKAAFGNSSYTYTTTKMIPKILLPAAHTVSLDTYSNAYSYCKEDYGELRISSADGRDYPGGTKFTITGPPGYGTQTYVLNSSTISFPIPATTFPAGTYTITADYGCGTPVSSTVTLNGVFSGKALSYTAERTCAGLKVTPKGSMTYQGVNTTTYYKLVNGPEGYDKTLKSPGDYFVFSKPGTYVLGIQYTNDVTKCVIKTDTINYAISPLALNEKETSAYECVDAATGIIQLSAINGVAPYTYELWNKSNTAKVGVPDITSSDRVHFTYGQAGNTYTVHVTDQCGNTFSQKVILIKLSTDRIVSSNDRVCAGDSIFLKCMTLGQTTYTWKGPNGFTSTEQNPVLGNAGVNMSGWYKVSVQPEFCGAAVQDSVYVTVYALTAGAVSPNQKLCVRYKAQPMSFLTTGGSESTVYQWQSSMDGVSNWKDIAGATGATYIPPSSISSRKRYYRVQATDCGTVFSNVITIKFKPCYIPVNPHIQSRTGRR